MIFLNIKRDIVFLLIALIAGVAMAIQGAINSLSSKTIGLTESTLWVHLSATITLVIIWVLGIGRGNWGNYNNISLGYYTGGIIGVIITYGVVISIPKLGASVATTAIIVGQVLTAFLIDHFGLFGLAHKSLSWLNFIGIVLLAIGAKLLLD